MGVDVGLFLLCASSLAFEIVLTRIFSVGQGYHFAFMIVSLALFYVIRNMGCGASGIAPIPAHHAERKSTRIHRHGVFPATASLVPEC